MPPTPPVEVRGASPWTDRLLALLAYRMNVLSALLGSVAVALLYFAARGFVPPWT